MRSLTALLLFLVLVSSVAAAGGGEAREADPSIPDPPVHHPAAHDPSRHEGVGVPPGEPLTGRSIYQLDSTWTDQRGVALSLRALAGAPVVLAMVYTHCDAVYPRIIGDMRRIAKADSVDADRVRFVLVSIDPFRDTVERLESFAKETGLDEAGWRLLRGEAGDVRELAAALGVQYREVGERDFAHSNLITVLDAKGEIVHQQQGLGVDPGATIAEIEKLLE